MAKAVSIVLQRKPRPPTQTTNTILMIEPVAFGFNAETAENNYFQQQTTSVQAKALAEFHAMVTLLRDRGVEVLTFKDRLLPHTPDAIFPSSCVSFHANGRAHLYPMFASNRRREIDHDILYAIRDKGFVLREIYDMRKLADSRQYLEGTGSMVFDRVNAVAYACRSPRTSEQWFRKTCKRLGYQPMLFTAKHSVTWKRLPIYHTAIMLSVGETFAVVCLDSIDKRKEKEALLDNFARTGKEFIAISEKQLQHFAGNMRQVRTGDNLDETLLVMSTRAYNSLEAEQIARLESHCPIVHSDISTIEDNGGASVGSMMAEVFLPKRASPNTSRET